MGRPFDTELELIPNTISYSQSLDSIIIKNYIINHLSNNYLVVGSGGSFSVAQIIALSINSIGGFARAVTPFELAEFSSLTDCNVIFFSAGGGNPDIINSYLFCKQMEASSTFIICLSQNSKLIQTAISRFHDYAFFECALPSGKDGFLAVNSTVCVTSLFQKMFEKESYIPCSTNDIYNNRTSIDNCLRCENLIVLGGRWTLPASFDFESKCTEAGLINVMPSDFRNFAHGRHHWIAKNPNTAIICLATNDEYNLAQKTIGYLPGEIPKVVFLTDKTGLSATLDSLLFVFHIVQQLGKVKGIDPGKPGVPRYGSQIYRINFSLLKEAEVKGIINKQLLYRMIRRKKVAIPWATEETLLSAATSFLQRLSSAHFHGIVIDYDNTVITDNNVSDDVFISCISSLVSFAKSGIGICFATGRGRSIREQLLTIISPDCLNNIYISYYNGAFTLPIASDLPSVTGDLSESLHNTQATLGNVLHQIPNLSISYRNECISMKGTQLALIEAYSILSSALLANSIQGIRVIQSNHSLDIVPNHVSKKNAVAFMSMRYGDNILCIGDSGNEKGNDYDLLSTTYSISVDQVSKSLISCWNITTLGFRGPLGTKEYLDNLVLSKKGIRINSRFLQVSKTR